MGSSATLWGNIDGDLGDDDQELDINTTVHKHIPSLQDGFKIHWRQK